MPGNFYIFNARIVNEGEIFVGSLIIRDGLIRKIIRKGEAGTEAGETSGLPSLDAGGKILIPGVIDDQVHFREPGLTHKGDIYTESRAATAGGVTSFMDMPNTQPQTLTQELLEEKYGLAADKSIANYSFYIGASNDNLDEILKTDPGKVCGLKLFMGASTGNMLVDNPETLDRIFSNVKFLIAVHCEDEAIIRTNTERFRELYGEDVPSYAHPLIRSEEACYRSTSLAVKLARKYDARLHVLHLSTAREMTLFSNDRPLTEKRITAEVCIHHLWFSDNDYKTLGNLIKWNPAIKTIQDREALWKALLEDKIDVIATDHAPHTLEEKSKKYFKAPSGGPLVQHSLPAMLDFYRQGRLSLEKIVEKMCHAPADCYRVDRRGYIREGYWADIVLIDPDQPWEVSPSNIYYKCRWSPFEKHIFSSRITHTFVNGNLVYESKPQFLEGHFNEASRGMRLEFNR
jgi:dihydroorotase